MPFVEMFVVKLNVQSKTFINAKNIAFDRLVAIAAPLPSGSAWGSTPEGPSCEARRERDAIDGCLVIVEIGCGRRTNLKHYPAGSEIIWSCSRAHRKLSSADHLVWHYICVFSWNMPLQHINNPRTFICIKLKFKRQRSWDAVPPLASDKIRLCPRARDNQCVSWKCILPSRAQEKFERPPGLVSIV